jgi:hypothetical protein
MTYMDRLRNKYKYSITKNISIDDIILVRRNDFKPI